MPDFLWIILYMLAVVAGSSVFPLSTLWFLTRKWN